MPRAKADNVVIHRVELGGKERELLEGALAAFQFNRIASPLVQGLSDVSFVVTAAALLAVFFPDLKAYLPKNPVDPSETIDAVTDWIDNRRTEAQQYGESAKETAEWWASLNPFNLPFKVAEGIVS